MIKRIMIDNCQQVCFLITEKSFRGGISGLILIFKKQYLIGSYLWIGSIRDQILKNNQLLIEAAQFRKPHMHRLLTYFSNMVQ